MLIYFYSKDGREAVDVLWKIEIDIPVKKDQWKRPRFQISLYLHGPRRIDYIQLYMPAAKK